MDAANTCRDTDTLHQLLEATFGAGAWSLLDVCCMCASSKLLRSAWLQLLKQHPSPAWLVTAVADVASAKTPAVQSKATSVVEWLLDSLSEAALAQHPSVSAGLLTIPNIPLQLAEQLCRYGVRVPYEQIVAAARRRVAGVEVWVLTQSALGMDAGIPAAAKMVCNGVMPQKPNVVELTGQTPLPTDDLLGLLQLMINCSSSAVANQVLDLLPTSLEPGFARRLLVTAAVRQHTCVAELLRAPSVQPHIDASTLTMVLRLFVVKNYYKRVDDDDDEDADDDEDDMDETEYYEHHRSPFETVPPLPAAQQIRVEAVVELLHAALVAGPCRPMSVCFAARYLCGLPSAQQLATDHVLQLMQASIEQQLGSGCESFCQLPAAQNLDQQQVVKLLRMAAAAGRSGGVAALRTLPAAQQISRESAAELLNTAASAGSSECISILITLPAAQQLSREDLYEMLYRAAAAGSIRWFGNISILPAVQQLSTENVAELLQVAVVNSDHGCAYELHSLPAARLLSREHVVELLHTAMTKGTFGFAYYVCRLPSAQQLSWEDVVKLLHTAFAAGNTHGVTDLCRLPGARLLSREHVVELLHMAVAKGMCCIKDLCKLPSAQQLDRTIVEGLIHEAVASNAFSDVSWPDALRALRSLGAPDGDLIVA